MMLEARPQIVICDHSNVRFLQKLIGQDKSQMQMFNDETEQYDRFVKHVTNGARTADETAEMDAILTKTPYFKHCLLAHRAPVCLRLKKVLAGQVPQRVIFDRSSMRGKMAIHGKVAWLTNISYPVYGSYIKHLYERCKRCFSMYEHCNELLKSVPAENIHIAYSFP